MKPAATSCAVGRAPTGSSASRVNDRLAGGPDDDFLRGGAGHDVMKGKTGIDRINAHDGERDVKISCGPGPNRLEGAKRDKRLDPRPRSC